jgi:hypothetical protein
MDWSGLTNRELVFLYHRVYLNERDFVKTYGKISGYKCLDNKYGFLQDLNSECLKRNIDPATYNDSEVQINPDYTAKVHDNGCIEVGCVTVSYEKLKEITKLAEKKHKENEKEDLPF